MFFNLLVGVDAHDEVVAHQLGLAEGIGVPKVDHVVAAVTPNANLKQNSICHDFFENKFFNSKYFVEVFQFRRKSVKKQL